MDPCHHLPTLVDQLDRGGLRERAARALLGQRPPYVLGIHGDWGAGKTSFLRQLQHHLGGACPADLVAEHTDAKSTLQISKNEDADQAVVVWFDAWRYQHEASPVVALLHEVRSQLAAWIKLKNWLVKQTQVAVETALMHLEQLCKIVLTQSVAGIFGASKGDSIVATVREVGERYDRAHLAERLATDSVTDHLSEAFNQLLFNPGSALWHLLPKELHPKENQSRRLVVIIDDLDRCEPEATYRLLEGIKVYLHLSNCVFAIGMDERIVAEAIAARVPKELTHVNRPERAFEYMEKLFQDVVRLPIVPNVGILLRRALDAEGLGNDGAAQAVLAVAQQYEGCLPANPRKLRNFAVTLAQFIGVAKSADAAVFPALPKSGDLLTQRRRETLALILAYLHHFHSDIYRVLEARPAFYNELLTWARKSESAQPALRGLQGTHVKEPPPEPGAAADTTAGGGGKMREIYSDYSRGTQMRMQTLIRDAGEFTADQVAALRLK